MKWCQSFIYCHCNELMRYIFFLHFSVKYMLKHSSVADLFSDILSHVKKIVFPCWFLLSSREILECTVWIPVRLLKRLLQRYQVHGSPRFYLSFLNSAFKYWLESNIKKHLKRKGGGLSVCMAPGRHEELVWEWCILSPTGSIGIIYG